MQRRREYVFGYASLLERCRASSGAAVRDGNVQMCHLTGYRRTWNVAMDNSRTIPGYKYYVNSATGAREPWFVSFLNIVPEHGASVNGVLFEVDREQLSRLDQRERNYARVDVSSEVSPAVDGTVWAYVGTAAAIERFRTGQRAGSAVISREYCERVRGDFARIGAAALREFSDRTDAPPCPILDLRRIDLPADAVAEHIAAASPSRAVSP